MGAMSENRGPAGPEKGQGITKRVGTADRDEAIERLGEHWQAGRLDPGEHELRGTRAKASVTQADLDALFVDLPGPGREPELTRTVASDGGRGLLASMRETIMALTPFLALVLFFTTGFQWMWFLLVPVMGILLYGPDGGTKKGRGRDRGRNRGRGR